MSIEAINYFRSVRFGDRYPSRKLLMMLLADRADEEYSCLPSIGLLADEMETDRRAIQRLLKRLVEDGYLSIEDRSRTNKSTASNRYHLHGPWDGWSGTEGRPFDVIETSRCSSSKSKVTQRRRVRVLVRDGNQCLACGATEDLTLDHIKHKSKGGGDEDSNLRTLCRSCNSRRGTGFLAEVDQ